MKPKTSSRSIDLNMLARKAGVSELASIGSVVTRVMQIIRNPNSSVGDLKELIEIDPPLSAKVLRRSNSAYYGLKRAISSIQESIVFLGFNALKELALNLKIGKLFENDIAIGMYSRKILWKHSLAVALCAKYIYRREFREHGEDIYSAGLLHDIGIIVEEQFLPTQFKEIISKTETELKELESVEKEFLGFTHSDIGEKITIAWNMPEDLIKCIAYHHAPLRVPPEYIRGTYVIFISDYICNKNGLGFEPVLENDEKLYVDFLARLNLSEDSIELILCDVQDELAEMEKNGELYP